MLKLLLLPLILALCVISCARSGYNAIQPHQEEFPAAKTEERNVVLSDAHRLHAIADNSLTIGMPLEEVNFVLKERGLSQKLMDHSGNRTTLGYRMDGSPKQTLIITLEPDDQRKWHVAGWRIEGD